jgi:hypothetical protein
MRQVLSTKLGYIDNRVTNYRLDITNDKMVYLVVAFTQCSVGDYQHRIWPSETGKDVHTNAQLNLGYGLVLTLHER